eukprot:TRINITY_DN1700_c0_g2_i1.p1 TRINITY_DN1700_c0_g2~~TRINITY_DN1700_c0_g2_i1.p1  ORF type:complete len:111 (+),score=31.83 TRINITY_DN1700_c0_g2_i1:66-398(+)
MCIRDRRRVHGDSILSNNTCTVVAMKVVVFALVLLCFISVALANVVKKEQKVQKRPLIQNPVRGLLRRFRGNGQEREVAAAETAEICCCTYSIYGACTHQGFQIGRRCYC